MSTDATELTCVTSSDGNSPSLSSVTTVQMIRPKSSSARARAEVNILLLPISKVRILLCYKEVEFQGISQPLASTLSYTLPEPGEKLFSRLRQVPHSVPWLLLPFLKQKQSFCRCGFFFLQ